MGVIIENKKLKDYLSKFFRVKDDVVLENYKGRWLYYKDVLIPHIANDELEDYYFSGESVVETTKDLEDSKIYFLNTFEGIFRKDYSLLCKLRFSYEISPIEYFIFVKNRSFVGILYKEDPILDWANYVFLETDKKPKLNVVVDVFELKKKLIHLLKMASLNAEEEMFYRLEEINK